MFLVGPVLATVIATALEEIQVAVGVQLLTIALPRLLKRLPLQPRLLPRALPMGRITLISRLDPNLRASALRVKCSVKIAARRILHYGEEMKKGSQSVMLAVRHLENIADDLGLYHKLHGEHRPIQMRKTVIKRRKRIVPTNFSSIANTGPASRHGGQSSTSSNSPSPPSTHHTLSPRLPNPYGPLPPLWANQRHSSQSYSPEPQDFTTRRAYNPASSPIFPSSYNEQNTLPPIRLPVSQHSHFLSPTTPSIQHVGDAIPLPKRKFDSPEQTSKRLRGINSLLKPSRYEEQDPLEGARVLLSLGSRESVIRKRAELIGEIDVLAEKMDRLKRAVAECDDFLGKV